MHGDPVFFQETFEFPHKQQCPFSKYFPEQLIFIAATARQIFPPLLLLTYFHKFLNSHRYFPPPINRAVNDLASSNSDLPIEKSLTQFTESRQLSTFPYDILFCYHHSQ
jgi:hypothetical protein